MIVASLLASSSFIMTNKILIKAVGTDAAILLGELCSEYNYWEQRNELTNKYWFFSTRENIEDNTGLSEHKQRMAINILLKMELIETKRMGIPCKTYYKLNETNILNCYTSTQKKLIEMPKSPVVENLDNKNLNNSSTSDEIFKEPDIENLDINKNKNKNNENHTHEAEPIEEKKEYAIKVTMTEKEYNDLVNTYGIDMAKQLIEQLSLYKQSKGKSYESDYAAILYWVTERVHEIEKKDANYKAFKNKTNNNKKPNFDQREYPPGFFDGLYANGIRK